METTTYWAIPENYTIGRTFSTFTQAASEAAKMLGEERRRVWVDERVSGPTGDRPVLRHIIEMRTEDLTIGRPVS